MCEWCGKEFTYYPYRKGDVKYCSYDCYHKATRKYYVITCANCGKEIEVEAKKKNRKFCSKECWDEYRRNRQRVATTGHDGYRYVWFTDGTGEQEHRYIMENLLGRKLTTNEVVHHIDGNRANNDIKNLQLMTRGEHSKLHRELELKQGKVLFHADE